MIGSFWNLCRACPSMPVDKLHSEYRSTYRWHEYRGGAQAAAPAEEAPVVRRAPLPSQAIVPRAPNIEPAMPRRKKYPGLAYKTNEIFEAAAAGLPSGMAANHRDIGGGSYTLDRARSMERTKYLASRGERRSKSEGPRAQANGQAHIPAPGPPPRNWTDTVEEKLTSPSIAEKGGAGAPGGSEYRNQFAWPRDGERPAAGGAGGAEGQPRKSVSMGQLRAAQTNKRRPVEGGATELEPLMNHADEDDEHKKFIEEYAPNGEAPVHRKSALRSALASLRGPPGARSEYKKKFRPFSHYVFEASKGTFTECGRGGAEPPGGARPARADSWYSEVLDLRKRAGEYKYRGWGTELAPSHLTELYTKQLELWAQVARRSSLSALSLASADYRGISKEEKDKENESKNARMSPKKPVSFRSAPHQSIHAKLQETRQQETPAQRAQRHKLHGHSFENSVSEGAAGGAGGAARGGSAEPGDATGHFRSPKRRPRSADPKPLSEERRRPSKPGGLALNTSHKYIPEAVIRDRRPDVPFSSPKRKIRPRVDITVDDDAIPLRSGSAFREHRLLDDSPVVKSPPEPTRVKSPEQMNMRSPDPVNWTVPLDTGKTFTVTQNVKNDELMKRPGSDFKGAWGGDDHSASLSAPLEVRPAELASVHQPSPSKTDGAPPKSVEISQKSPAGLKHAKTPTSPPNLTPIDELKVLDVSKPLLNGGPSPVSAEAPAFEMAALVGKTPDGFKPTEATQKPHGGVDTAVVANSGGVDTAVVAGPGSVAADVLEKARTRFDQFWGKKDGNNDSV